MKIHRHKVRITFESLLNMAIEYINHKFKNYEIIGIYDSKEHPSSKYFTQEISMSIDSYESIEWYFDLKSKSGTMNEVQIDRQTIVIDLIYDILTNEFDGWINQLTVHKKNIKFNIDVPCEIKIDNGEFEILVDPEYC
jgi:hypothetical protein